MNKIYNDLEENGIYSSENLIDNFELKNLKEEFNIDENVKIFENIGNITEIQKISNTLYKLFEKEEIKDSLKKYFGQMPKCSLIHFSRTFPSFKTDEKKSISSGSVLGFHNDDIGKQIKINFLLTDLSIESNGLEYALRSHKISFLDNLILKILNKFSLFKNWNKHFLNYQINKILGLRPNFMNEKKIKKKFKIKRIFGKAGLVYIFDTNGFHRQAHVINQKSELPFRELITVYLIPDNV